MTRGYVILRNGELARYWVAPAAVGLASMGTPTLFRSYDEARNAVRRVQRYHRRHEVFRPPTLKIIRLEAPKP
jgi:uncharacterized protein (UPF0297 family)